LPPSHKAEFSVDILFFEPLGLGGENIFHNMQSNSNQDCNLDEPKGKTAMQSTNHLAAAEIPRKRNMIDFMCTMLYTLRKLPMRYRKLK
jgi:hypothetical protein